MRQSEELEREMRQRAKGKSRGVDKLEKSHREERRQYMREKEREEELQAERERQRKIEAARKRRELRKRKLVSSLAQMLSFAYSNASSVVEFRLKACVLLIARCFFLSSDF